MPLHALRHTAAAAWLAAGNSLMYVQRQLDHADIATTERHYGHLERHVLAAGAIATEAAIARAAAGPPLKQRSSTADRGRLSRPRYRPHPRNCRPRYRASASYVGWAANSPRASASHRSTSSATNRSGPSSPPSWSTGSDQCEPPRTPTRARQRAPGRRHSVAAAARTSKLPAPVWSCHRRPKSGWCPALARSWKRSFDGMISAV